jgi:hypothetical protein
MVRYLISLNWDGFLRSTIFTAFEAYGSALVGITPTELPAEVSRDVSGTSVLPARRG